MERINRLCRILAVCALTLFIGIGIFDLMPHSEAAQNAAASLEQQIYEIQTALNQDNKEKITLFEPDSLHKEYSDDQLHQMIDEWIKNVCKECSYSDEALNKVKQEMVSLYKKQKEIVSDPIYSQVSNIIFQSAAIILILCNINILFVFRKQRRRNKQIKANAQTTDNANNLDKSVDIANINTADITEKTHSAAIDIDDTSIT